MLSCWLMHVAREEIVCISVNSESKTECLLESRVFVGDVVSDGTGLCRGGGQCKLWPTFQPRDSSNRLKLCLCVCGCV